MPHTLPPPNFSAKQKHQRAVAIPASAAQWLIQELAEDGINLQALYDGTTLNAEWACHPEATLGYDDYALLVKRALELTGNAALGLSAPRNTNYLSRFGFWGYAVMSCNTLGVALHTCARYLPLTGSLVKIQLSAEQEATQLTISPAFDFVQGDIWRFGVEKFLAASQLSASWLINQPLRIEKVMLNYPAPEHADRYSQLLDCPVQFDCDSTCLELADEVLHLPLLTSQPQLADLCRDRCAQALGALQAEDLLIGAIQEFIWKSLSQTPSLEQVAAELGLTSRTLRRRLQERGSSYQQILDTVREAVARDYLLNTELSIEQIAALIGFSEATTFRSTFKRWTGQSAADIRRTSK